jgi:hypothetical protein
MPLRVTFAACLYRSIADTGDRLDIRHPKRVVVPVLIWLLTTLSPYWIWGSQAVRMELRLAILGLAALVLVALATLIADSSRLARDLASVRRREAYFREELDTALEQLHVPPLQQRSLGRPTGFNLGSAAYHAQNPLVQKERDVCRRHLERLRMILRGVPGRAARSE